MTSQDADHYDYYSHLYDPDWSRDNVGLRPRKRRTPKQDRQQIVAGLTDAAVGMEAGFTTTYQPARHEEGWLRDSIRQFYDLDLIVDVLAQVKGGKEANVYRCKANSLIGAELVAAKVYRPRKFRNLRNDKLYREGRTILKAEGGAVKSNDSRIIRALHKKTAYGSQVAHTSWLMHEFNTLSILHAQGAAVPKPISASENAILMSYIGDDRVAAPTLHETALDPEEAQALFDKIVRSIDLMLQAGFIHGDLSAYNVLYWQGKITIIDFPQVINARLNRRAYLVLQRDIRRICQYFSSYGIRADPHNIANAMWGKYQWMSENDLMADMSRELESPEEE